MFPGKFGLLSSAAGKWILLQSANKLICLRDRRIHLF
jgi:hypothetical protein